MSEPTQLLQCHHIVRVVAVATSIVAARHLFANGFHYPLLMLLAHVSIALVLEGLGIWTEAPAAQKWPQSWKSRSWQALFAVLVAIGLVLTYHSFLHNRNTTLCVMLLGLDWSTVLGRTERWLRQDKHRSVEFPLSIATFFLCIALLICRENWLVGKGVEFLLIAVACMAIARHLWLRGLVENPLSFSTIAVDAYGAGLVVCLPLAAFLLAITGWYNRRDFDMNGRIIWVIISAIAGSLALMSETRIKKLTSLLQEKVSLPSKIEFSIGSPAFVLLVLAIVEIDNCLTQHRPSTTSGVQWFSFAIAYLTTIDITSMASSTTLAAGASYMPVPSFKTQDDPIDNLKSPTPEETEAMCQADFTYASEPAPLRHIALAWHAVLGSLALLLAFYCAVGVPYTEPGKRSWDLDIVIARYDEPIEQVIRTAQLALDLPNIALTRTRQ